jgi:hypothetical protein
MPSAIFHGEAFGFVPGAESLRGPPIVADVGITAFEDLKGTFDLD